ncbi:MAG: hypothetical protein FD153_1021 [Rhodospirillaceae bacterium]|nr:MAG: hypothetical protein FD153_1021 [Rhodospirillaceae bacterium]
MEAVARLRQASGRNIPGLLLTGDTEVVLTGSAASLRTLYKPYTPAVLGPPPVPLELLHALRSFS